jgi:OOP family OmpA-OmpF porin
VSKYKYKNPDDRSDLEIMKNYENALLASGAEELFSCIDEECGNYPGFVWRNLNGLDPMTKGKRYKAFKLNTDDATAYIAILVNESAHFVHVIEVKEMETGLVDVDISKLTKSIDTKGSVSIYGIYFDTGKADLKAESKPALDQIAELLKERPDLSIYVVGHTDSDGSLDLNMSLSKDRANSVVQELVTVYEVEPSRVKPYGVGPLSPVESRYRAGQI